MHIPANAGATIFLFYFSLSLSCMPVQHTCECIEFSAGSSGNCGVFVNEFDITYTQ